MQAFLAALPTRLTALGHERAPDSPSKVVAPDESRGGLLPLIRRRLPAGGVQPRAPVAYTCDNFYLYGAGAPPTGESFFLALPWRNTRALQLWVDHVAEAFLPSLHRLILDHRACHTAKTLCWPANVAPVFLPPYSPELHPMERRWRALKDPLAAGSAKTIAALSDAVCTIIQASSQATLQSLPGFPYFVQAVKTAPQATYG